MLSHITAPKQSLHEASKKFTGGENYQIKHPVKNPSEIEASSFNFLDDIANVIGGLVIGAINIPAYLINGLDKPFGIQVGDGEEGMARQPLAKLIISGVTSAFLPLTTAYEAGIAPHTNQVSAKPVSFERIAQRWHTDKMPKIHSSVTGYARIAFNFMAGFAWGCVKAPLIALQDLFIERTAETPIMQLLKSPLRLLADLITTPFNTALDWVHNEALLLAKEKKESDAAAASKRYRNEDLKSRNKKLVHKPVDYLRASFGFLLGLIYSPFVGLARVFYPYGTLGYAENNEESFMQWAVKSPFRFIRGMCESTLTKAAEGFGRGFEVERTAEDILADKYNDVDIRSRLGQQQQDRPEPQPTHQQGYDYPSHSAYGHSSSALHSQRPTYRPQPSRDGRNHPDPYQQSWQEGRQDIGFGS
jgi:hypothetical protein